MEQPALDLPAPEGGRRPIIDVNEVIAEVAKRHQIRVRKDDPAMMLLTGMEMVLRRAAAEFEMACERANDDTSALMAQHVDRARGVAADVVDAAVKYQAEKMREAAHGLAVAVADEARKLLQQVGHEVAATKRSTQRAMTLAWVGAGVALATGLMLLGAVLGRVAA